MQRLVLLVLVLCVSGLVFPLRAQAPASESQGPGLRFELGQSWAALRAQAKATNKHLLLVLETTACQVCQQMAKQVYAQAPVGRALNTQFLALRVPLNAGTHDRAALQHWRAAARKLGQSDTVRVVPTFLFFSPQGRLVHRGQGGMDTPAFLALAAAALNPATQYYTQLERYQRGQSDLAALRELGRLAKALGDTAVAQRVGDAYFARLGAGEVYAKAHLDFLRRVTFSSADRTFALFHRAGARVDSSLGRPGVSQGLVDRIIAREEIQPSVAAAKQGGPAPAWGRITAAITQKYGAAYADRTVLFAQVNWYEVQQDWPSYLAHAVPLVERYVLPPEGAEGGFPAMLVNNFAWNVFLYSSDGALLTKALAWSDRAVKAWPHPAIIDTYAQLLYKLGRREDALRWEEVAFKLKQAEDGLGPRLKEYYARSYTTTLEMMKQGEPTWDLALVQERFLAAQARAAAPAPAVSAPATAAAVCRAGYRDNFEGAALDRARWSTVVRETQDLQIADGYLSLPTTKTDIFGRRTNTTPNLVLQPLPAGPFTATAKLILPARRGYQQAGLVVYGDDDHYVKLVLQARNTGADDAAARIFQFLREEQGRPHGGAGSNTAPLGAGYPDTVWVRLTSPNGKALRAAYSADGERFTEMPELQSLERLPAPKLGLLALAGSKGEPPVIEAKFDWFELCADASAR